MVRAEAKNHKDSTGGKPVTAGFRVSPVHRERPPTGPLRPQSACGSEYSCKRQGRRAGPCRSGLWQISRGRAHPPAEAVGVSWCGRTSLNRIRRTDGNEGSLRSLSWSLAARHTARARPSGSSVLAITEHGSTQPIVLEHNRRFEDVIRGAALRRTIAAHDFRSRNQDPAESVRWVSLHLLENPAAAALGKEVNGNLRRFAADTVSYLGDRLSLPLLKLECHFPPGQNIPLRPYRSCRFRRIGNWLSTSSQSRHQPPGTVLSYAQRRASPWLASRCASSC